MEIYEKLLAELETFTEAEQYLKDLYFLAEQNPELHSSLFCDEKFLSYFPPVFENLGTTQPPSPSSYTLYEWKPGSTGNGDDVSLGRHPRYFPKYRHHHTFFEIFYVLTGTCLHEVCGREERLDAGELVFLAPGTDHALSVFDDSLVLNIMVRKSTFEQAFFNLFRTQNVLSNFFLGSLYSNKKMRCLIIHTKGDLQIQHDILDMYSETGTSDYYQNQILSTLFRLFLLKVARRHSRDYTIPENTFTIRPSIIPDHNVNSEKNNTSEQSFLTNRQPEASTLEKHQDINYMEEIFNYIYENYSSISLASLAEHLHYSEGYCSRLIRQHTGKTFTELLADVRMQTAQAILKNTTMSIEELSYHIGYESKQSFIKAFRKSFGMTPGHYKKSLQNNSDV